MRKLIIGTILALSCLAHLSALAAELPSATGSSIRAALSSGRPSVVDFGARSCIPCKKMAPILEELNRELKGKANVLFNDVWKDDVLARDYRIQMIPTQIFFNAAGKEVKRHMGFMDKADILKELKALGLK
ncbi:thioredoxin family protein [Pelobacter propionicus]|uniref:Transcriptional regulator, Fis family n=1 Tax=Pelobacter propionicus (strain DSM 2379 / NBRC 103807 / OttBd1) TaxID=338966 RepID=A1AMB4_PELPD|nr:thioredoxin family protein [Pelobacter propionicus]ABK98484.1 transcriptional regulator, Fis family [Pelobacter propionicus DSM 2379]